AGIKEVMAPITKDELTPIIVATKESEEKRKKVSDKELYEMLHRQLAQSSKLGQSSLIQGQLNRFFH
ncbi:MAG: MerR family transcriptional regulator, partial [Bacilli bacterium]